LAGDWTTHLVQLATAQQIWWSTFAPNFTSFLNDVTDEWADEQTTANLERAQLATANNLADLAYTADVANATYQATTFLAGQSEQREFALADQDELFQQAEAAARRTFDVTSATLTRDGAAAGTPLLEGNAAAQATPAYNAARQAARQAFDLNTALPVAAFSVTEVATSYWLVTQTNGFASVQAAARATALDEFLTNTSNATLARRQNIAGLTSSFEQAWVSSHAAGISAFATANPSPWATFAVAKAAAEQVRSATLAPARAAHDSNVANADHVLLSGLADSLAQFVNERTTFDNSDAASLIAADLSSAINAANDFLNFGSSGVDVLTAIGTPGGAGLSGFVRDAEAPAANVLDLVPVFPHLLRGAREPFLPSTAALPNDHVEPASGNMPRATMPREHSGSAELQNMTEHRNSTINAANPRTEEKKSTFNSVLGVATQVASGGVLPAAVATKTPRLWKEERVEGPSGTLVIYYDSASKSTGHIGTVQMMMPDGRSAFVGHIRRVNGELLVQSTDHDYGKGVDIPLEKLKYLFGRFAMPEDNAGWAAYLFSLDFKPTLSAEELHAHHVNALKSITGLIIIGTLQISEQVVQDAAINGGLKVGLKVVGGAVKYVVKGVERHLSRRQLKQLADQLGEKIDVHNPTPQQLERMEKKLNEVFENRASNGKMATIPHVDQSSGKLKLADTLLGTTEQANRIAGTGVLTCWSW
jgi:hypothetical protein